MLLCEVSRKWFQPVSAVPVCVWYGGEHLGVREQLLLADIQGRSEISRGDGSDFVRGSLLSSSSHNLRNRIISSCYW